MQAELSENKLTTVSIASGKIFMEANIAYLSNQHHSIVVSAFVDYLKKIRPEDRSLLEIGDLKQTIMDGNNASAR